MVALGWVVIITHCFSYTKARHCIEPLTYGNFLKVLETRMSTLVILDLVVTLTRATTKYRTILDYLYYMCQNVLKNEG